MLRHLFRRALVVLALATTVCVHPAFAEKKAPGGEAYRTDIRFLHVQPGQTLHNIVRRLYPEHKKEWPRLRADIVRSNPHAFVKGNEATMKAGVKLKLPSRQSIETAQIIKKSQKQVGEVVMTRGRAIAVGPNKISRKLTAGNAVYLGDKLITGEDGFLRLKMIDSALLDLRCFSIMVIEDYNIAPTSRASVLNLLQGSLRKVTGEIGRWSDDVYELKTPVASVGVRGTEYALRVFQSRGCDGSVPTGDDGLYLHVIKGLVDVYNEAETTSVAKDGTVYIPLPGAKPEAKEIEKDVIVIEKDAQPEATEEESDNSFWWWILGGVAALALI